MKDTVTRHHFIQLRAAGWSFVKIANELNVCRQTLQAWSKQYEKEIKDLHQLELDELREKYFASKTARTKLFGDALLDFKAEIDKRRGTYLPTEQLYKLMGRYAQLLKIELADD